MNGYEMTAETRKIIGGPIERKIVPAVFDVLASWATKCPTKFDGDCASAKKFPRKFDVIELCTKSRAERQRRGI